MADAVLILVSCADEAEARRIARALVERRLAACVHLRPHTSVYRWQGAVEEAAEISLLIKTTQAQAPAARDAIRALHSYSLPAILTLAAEAEALVLAWLHGETG